MKTCFTNWTMEENKRFESALVIHSEDVSDRWMKIASTIRGKNVVDVIKRYRELKEDVSDIEAGLVPIPGSRASDQERKKGVPWTEEEHSRFLMGLQKYGKGDWRNISRNFVVSKTPTQVASHAQKYYQNQLSDDIPTVNLCNTDYSDNHNPPSMNQSNWYHPNDGSAMALNSSQSQTASNGLGLEGRNLHGSAYNGAHKLILFLSNFLTVLILLVILTILCRMILIRSHTGFTNNCGIVHKLKMFSPLILDKFKLLVFTWDIFTALVSAV